MGKNIFSKSDKFTSEYCCSIIRVGEVKPIEGKDKIGYTLVNGETIVVRKDVKEGDILFYASNETQLHKDFLGANNLFESSSYELNANAKEVEPYILRNKELKQKVETLEKVIKKLDICSKFLLSYDAEILAAGDNETKKEELTIRYDNSRRTIIKYASENLTLDSSNEDCINAANKTVLEKKLVLDPIKKEIEDNTNFIRSHVGFFNKNGRVRAIRLGGVNSMGYLFSIDELAKWCPEVKDVYLPDIVGEDFDTVNGIEFIKAYVPFVPQRSSKGDGKSIDRKRNKKIEKFDRMIKGEFSFHYSSDPLPKCINRIKPNDMVSITLQIHGTSFGCGKLHVKTPIKLPIYKLLWNKFVDTTGLFKKLRVTDYIVEYGNVTSSRTVIKNQYINKKVTEGYYGVDIWSEYGNLIYPYLDEGMTVYGEIFGYLSGSDKMIQKNYDYGCEKGKNKLMPYRITTTNDNGTKHEWNVTEVKEWTEKLIKEHPELADRIHVIDLLYHGTLANLYPHLSLTDHWHENVLEEMRKDVVHFGMEKREPLCTTHNVPREGICVHIDNDEINENFKLKCQHFFDMERKAIDAGEVDIEMADAYVSES